MKQPCNLIGMLVTAALLAACGGPGSVAAPSVPSAPAGAAGPRAPLAHEIHKFGSLEYVYVTNSGSNNVSAYVVNTTSGALTPVRRSPRRTRPIPWGVAPAFGEFVYVANGVSTNEYSRRRSIVSAYSVNARSGVLMPLAGPPFADTGRGAADLKVDPTRPFAYLVNVYSDSVSAYTINAATGALTPVPGSPFAAGGEPETVTSIPPASSSTYPTPSPTMSPRTPSTRAPVR